MISGIKVFVPFRGAWFSIMKRNSAQPRAGCLATFHKRLLSLNNFKKIEEFPRLKIYKNGLISISRIVFYLIMITGQVFCNVIKNLTR